MSEPSPVRSRSTKSFVAGAKPEDPELMAAWRELHPVQPWRGQDGKGGFLGWANRLDERVGAGRHGRGSRGSTIPINQRELLRQLVRDWRAILAVVVGGVLWVAVGFIVGFPVTFVGITIAAGRARGLQRERIRAELALLGRLPPTAS